MNARKTLALLLALLLVLSLYACGDKKVTTEEPVVEGISASGETLRVQAERGVPSLDSAAAEDRTSFEVIANFTDGLMQMDAAGSPVKALAEAVQVSGDGKTYTFTIRDDAIWVDSTGTYYADVTANDFVFAWQRAVSPTAGYGYSYLISEVALIKNGSAIKEGKLDQTKLGVTAQDEKTLVVRLEAPVPYFLSLLYIPTFYPINQQFYQECGDTYGISAATVLSNGAFIMGEDYQPTATAFSLSKNVSYYGAPSVALGGLSYQVIPDSQAALQAYQNGALDVTTLSGEQIAQEAENSEFQTENAGNLWYIAVNQDAYDFLDNTAMRKALSAAYDRETIVSEIVKDGSTAANYIVPRGLAIGPDGKDYRDTASNYAEEGMAEAQEYYATACEELGVNTFEIELLIEDNAIAQSVASYIKEQWEQLEGLSVKLKVVTRSQRTENLRNGEFCTSLTCWWPDYADPITYLGVWVSNGASNYGNWKNRKYDAIIEDCTSGGLATDAAGRWAALKQAEDILMEDMAVLPVYQQGSAMMVRTGVEGLACHAAALNRVFKDVTIAVDA